MLIAIEGIDGSGKGTQAARLADAFRANGLRAALLGFPRYEATFFGRAVGEFLNGRFGTLTEANPYLVALLFAGDRFESRELLARELAQNDVVVLDRYVASNIAHQGAKLPEERRGELTEFVERLEYTVYGLPRADLTLLLDLPVAIAQTLVGRKHARAYTEKSHDLQEADADYLERVRQVYRTLAAARTDWEIVACLAGDALRPVEEIASELYVRVAARRSGG